jgi:serine/threonine protein phosphatase PrpC
LQVRLGLASETGKRERNEDYLGATTGAPGQSVVGALADGMGGALGGREAAETAVRSFIDGYCSQPHTLDVQRAASCVLDAINRWIFAQGHTDPNLLGMATTFTALILHGRKAHVFHVGDSRAYRLREDRLERLTTDHTFDRAGLSHVLRRALGLEDGVRLDHGVHLLKLHDRFMLCSDGVHGALSDKRLREILAQRAAPEQTARHLVSTALDQGGTDNASALVIDVVGLAPVNRSDLEMTLGALPIKELPAIGETVDGFVLEEIVSDGRYSRLIRARDTIGEREVALKFPHPRVASEASYRMAFVREAWIVAHVRSPWIGQVLDLPPGRQSRLYSVMPFYDGETLERRLRRPPALSLREGVDIATKLARAIAALHRAGIIHRDIKPDNIILKPDGGLKLVDLGVARVPRMEEFPLEDIPGTPSYMAPELFDGKGGDELSDLFALGVTLFRSFTGGAYPYGEVEPFSHPRFTKPAPLSRYRPDLPSWLDSTLAKAFAPEPAERFGDVLELAFELESGPAAGEAPPRRPLPLYQRNPLAFWQFTAAALAALAFWLAIR